MELQKSDRAKPHHKKNTSIYSQKALHIYAACMLVLSSTTGAVAEWLKWAIVLLITAQGSENVMNAEPSCEGLGFNSACPPGFGHNCK